MDCSTLGFPVHHQLPDLAQTHVHRVGDTIQPSHPLSSLSPAAFDLSQHQGQLFTWGGQSIGASVSALVLPMNIQDWSSLGWTGWIFLQCKGLSRVLPNTTFEKHQFFSFLYGPALASIHDYWKTIALTRRTFAGKVISLLFNMLSRLIISSLPRSKDLLISWLQSPSAVILEPPKIKSHFFHCFLIYLPWSVGTGCHDLHLLNVEF